MPLIVEGLPLDSVPDNVREFITSHAQLQEASTTLRDLPSREVGPKGLLYIGQHEFAVVSPSTENIEIIGADDATTCHILILRHSGSGVTGMTHLDGGGTDDGIATMFDKVKKLSHGAPEGRFEAHLTGGFLDSRGLSVQLTKEIFGALMKLSDDVHLLTACVTDWNDRLMGKTHFPVIYGLAFELRSAELYPATFPDKGPDIDIRSASHFSGGSKMEDIFDGKCLRFGPYVWSKSMCRNVSNWIGAPDSFLLENFSTSPEQEPPHFTDHMRRSMCAMRDNPEPSRTLFRGRRPRVYRMQSDGRWAKT